MSTTITTNSSLSGLQIDVGQSLPPLTDHAVSVSLPTWKDVVDYEEGDKRIKDVMITGYPRFFIHLSIQKVSSATYYRKYTYRRTLCSYPGYVSRNSAPAVNHASSSPPKK